VLCMMGCRNFDPSELFRCGTEFIHVTGSHHRVAIHRHRAKGSLEWNVGQIRTPIAWMR
jgi:hypothetical protein